MSSSPVPAHLGIIMDGNGRWAKARNLPRSNGHSEGLVTAKAIVASAAEAGITYLTLYAFSTENWKRTTEEVAFLMKLIKQRLRSEYQFYRENRIRVVHSGDLTRLPRDIQHEILAVEDDTKDFDGLTVNLAINYGGRDEIIRACKAAIAAGVPPEELGEGNIAAYLDQPHIPDIDLLIRTGGEQRLSNFMLWRSSYAELYFSDTLWPDFTGEELRRVLDWYQNRQRRFGGIHD